MEIKPLVVVALLEDVPASSLVRGQVGTIVERLASGVFEVEFSDNNGRPYATSALSADKLLVLRYTATEAADGPDSFMR